jgi:glyceraldehyde 3-phosphate dehydrogenase
MKAKVAINGFGRIGRMVFRRAMMDDALDIVAVNASYPAETLAHLVKYDSIHGIFDGEVRAEENALIINGKRVQLVSKRDPKQLPWRELGVDIVIEATGKFKTEETAGQHLEAGARKVVITAPAKDPKIKQLVIGVNDHEYEPEKHHIISNASCTTNCLAPLAKVLNDQFGIENGLMTTVHSYTNDQNNIDNPHSDLRRARSCGQSIIPTSTGAAKALSVVLPELTGKLHGMALRVPTPNVSLVDLVVDLKQEVSVDDVNAALRKAAEGEMKGVIGISDEPLVSIDFTGNELSSIIDSPSTMVIGDNKVKVLAWYDNEWGYSSRVVDLTKKIGVELMERIEA